jgi:hypothetical protein
MKPCTFRFMCRVGVMRFIRRLHVYCIHSLNLCRIVYANDSINVSIHVQYNSKHVQKWFTSPIFAVNMNLLVDINGSPQRSGYHGRDACQWRTSLPFDTLF